MADKVAGAPGDTPSPASAASTSSEPAPKAEEPKAPVETPKAPEPKAEEPKGEEPVRTLMGSVGEPAKEGEPPKKEGEGDEPAKEPAKAPAEYKLSLPDGSALGTEDVDKVAAFAQKHGLSQEVAQAALELSNTVVSERETAYNESIKPGGAKWTENVKAWNAASLKDPEIGGSTDAVNESALAAKTAIQTFFGDDAKHLLAFLEESGMSSHPMILKGFARIYKRMQEGTIRRDAVPSEPEKKPMAQRLYNKTPQTEGQAK